MSILTEDSLEFAKLHIEKFFDSDFFPKAFEFEAIWYYWEDVKKHLMTFNINKLQVNLPKITPMIKPKGTYRIVHQLDPINAIIYTSLAYLVAESIERKRVPIDEQIACSYRIDVENGSFFGSGNGYNDFTERSEELANTYGYVLETDISDFYNQIYLHRLNNAIEFADVSLQQLAKEIEDFISLINNKASKGVPVGPSASIIMAEAIMIDIDDFIINKGFSHTRYVDDFRIFSNSKSDLMDILENLTLYLYDNHRLTLSPEKTVLIPSDEFIARKLHNQYVIEKKELLDELSNFNPYNFEVDEDEPDEVEIEIELLKRTFSKIMDYNVIDIGLSRSLIRKARTYLVEEISEGLLDNFTFFLPVVNDLILYLHRITDNYFISKNMALFEKIIQNNSFHCRLARFWLEWYFSEFPLFLKNKEICTFIMNGQNIENQAKLAINTNNISWIRTLKNKVNSFGDWERRAILNAARILPKDERSSWLNSYSKNTTNILEKWICNWVIET